MIITNFCACLQAAASPCSLLCYNSWDLELFKFTQNQQIGSKFKLYNSVELLVHVFRKSTCISQMQHRKHDIMLFWKLWLLNPEARRWSVVSMGLCAPPLFESERKSSKGHIFLYWYLSIYKVGTHTNLLNSITNNFWFLTWLSTVSKWW